MAEILFVQRFPAKAFLIRRFSRVWPVLIVFIAVMFVVSRYTSALGPPLRPSAVLTVLTFTYGYGRLFGIGWHAAEHVWSLCIEEHSYLLLLAVAAITGRAGRPASVILTVLAIASVSDAILRVTALHQSYYDVYWSTHAALLNIFAPVVAFLSRDKLQALAGKSSGFVSIFCGAVAVCLHYHKAPDYVTESLSPLFLAVAITMLPEAQEWLLRALEWKPLRMFGLWSYSIYIWQQPYMVLGMHSSAIDRLSFLGLAIFTGISSFYFVEQPMRVGLNKAFAPRRLVSPVTVPPTPTSDSRSAVR